MPNEGFVDSVRGTNTLYLPVRWRKQFSWKAGDIIEIKAGKRSVNAHVQMAKKRRLAISQDIHEELKLPNVPISWKVQKKQLIFGPFVAAYCINTGQVERPFDSNTDVLRDTSLIAAELSVPFYVISPGGFHQESQTATGWIFNAADRLWQESELPWPEFCIRKIVTVPPKWKNRIQEDERLIEISNCQMLTRKIGSKWNVHSILSGNSKIAACLPVTRRLRTVDLLERLLALFPSLYIKPEMGTQGKNIYRLSRKNGNAIIEFQAAGVTKVRHLDFVKQEIWIRKKFLSRQKFLVQQGIPLLRDKQGRTSDFRWLIQKDGTADWKVTARVARVAQAGSITTNLSTGGDVWKADEFLKQTDFNETKIKGCLSKLDSLAIQIAQELEAAVGVMGELGIDFGLDRTGKAWLIEVNPRPGRKMLRILDSEVRALSLRRPLEYARYTTGFPVT